MKSKQIVLAVSLLLLAGIIFSSTSTVITIYNTMVKSKVSAEQALGDLDSAYQRRYALVDNLVAVVKETKAFEQSLIDVERDILAKVAEAKASATKMTLEAPNAAAMRMGKEAQLNNFLMQTLDKLMVLAQHYPQITDPVLKDRTATFEALKGLKWSLQELENEVQTQRQRLNDCVRTYNQNIQIFPANLLAADWGFTKMAGFEVRTSEAREDVRIKF